MPPGPLPLHPTVRGYSGKHPASPLRELSVPSEGVRASIPVPELPADRLWDPRTSSWWVDVWQSPMRLEWDPADTHALLQLAYLIDEFWRIVGSDDVDHLGMVKVSKAIMDRLVRLGLDPFARRSLNWLLVQTEKAEAERDESKERTAASRGRRAEPKKRGLSGLQ